MRQLKLAIVILMLVAAPAFAGTIQALTGSGTNPWNGFGITDPRLAYTRLLDASPYPDADFGPPVTGLFCGSPDCTVLTDGIQSIFFTQPGFNQGGVVYGYDPELYFSPVLDFTFATPVRTFAFIMLDQSGNNDAFQITFHGMNQGEDYVAPPIYMNSIADPDGTDCTIPFVYDEVTENVISGGCTVVELGVYSTDTYITGVTMVAPDFADNYDPPNGLWFRYDLGEVPEPASILDRKSVV